MPAPPILIKKFATTPEFLSLLNGEPGFSVLDHKLYIGYGGTSWFIGGGPAVTYQPIDATLTALAALTIAANSLSIGSGVDAFTQTTFAANTFPARASTGNLVAKAITDFGLSLVDDANAAAGRTTLGLGNVDNTSDVNKPVSTAQQTAIDAAVVGLLDFKGSTDCSSNPNYPAASKGDSYLVSVAGRIGGAAGVIVSIGDMIVASANNAGGDQAAVGADWFVLEANIPNLSEALIAGHVALRV